MGNNFRVLCVLKDRYGDSDVEIGVNFFGACNIWAELPRPSEITDFTRYTSPDYLLNKQQDIQNEQTTYSFTI